MSPGALLVERIARALVDEPDQVRVFETRGTHICVVELHVARRDRGKVIGRRGAHADALRALLAALAGKEDRRYVLEIVED